MSGLAVSDCDVINCDEAEFVGASIMNGMDNKPFQDIVIKRAQQIKPLSALKLRSASGVSNVTVNSNVLFSRLLIVLSRKDSMETYFSFELAPEPTSLFHDCLMRKTAKAALGTELLRLLPAQQVTDVPKTFVVDGGFLLHKVKWPGIGSYTDVCKHYSLYIQQHYGANSTIVFDGYCTGASVKDQEHFRRVQKAKSAPDIAVSAEKPIYKNQSHFLANERNKKSFVILLTSHLKSIGYTVMQAVNDADTLVVKTALEIAVTQPVTVVATDTDILVMLLYHFTESHKNIFMLSETNNTTAIPIQTLRECVGCNTAKQLLLIHAISGCDSTSSLFGHGKVAVFKKLTKRPDLSPHIEIFGDLTASQEVVTRAGLPLLSVVYGGQPTDSLDRLRYLQYLSVTSTSSVPLKPERLPPTSRAAIFHLFRVHCQVAQWKTLSTKSIDPLLWGWSSFDDRFVPIMTDLQPAPDGILNVVRCKCKAGSERSCVTQLCSCRKHGLPCVAACKNCNGEACENIATHPTILHTDETVTSDDDEGDEDRQVEYDNDYEDVIPIDCTAFDIPWIDEEVVVTCGGIFQM